MTSCSIGKPTRWRSSFSTVQDVMFTRKVMQESLKILETVNTFYSQSFSQLINITIAVLAFAGIVLPILITLYQKRIFRLEHQAIEKSVFDKLKSEFDSKILELQNEYKAKEEELNSKMLDMKNEIGREIANAEGGIFHVQGNNELKSGQIVDALISFIESAIKNIEAEDNLNLRIVLGLCSNNCLSNLSEIHFQHDEFLEGKISKLIDKISKYNEKDTFTDQILDLKKSLSQAKSRKPNV